MKNKPGSKKGMVLNHLKNGRTLTPQVALRLYGHMRLASCINRLRNEGFDIKTNIRYGLFHRDQYDEYSMEQSK